MRQPCTACGQPMFRRDDGKYLCSGCGRLTPVDPLAAALGLDGSQTTRGVVSEVKEGGEVPNTPNREVSEIPGPLTSDTDTSDTSNSVLRYELRDGAWLDGQDFPPLEYTVPGLMPAGLGIIAAPPKAGQEPARPRLAARRRPRRVGARHGSVSARPATCSTSRSRTATGACRPGAVSCSATASPIPDRFRYILPSRPARCSPCSATRSAATRTPGSIVLDTLGRIMPLPIQGETTYQRDYRVAVALKRFADDRPGLTVVVIHHTRKALADDFIDSMSGTHGLAGAADTIIMLSRGRGKGEGTLRVTGRDVTEADYAVKFRDGVWPLDGDDLARPAPMSGAAPRPARSADLSAEIIEFVRQQPRRAPRPGVGTSSAMTPTRYLKRLTDSGGSPG